MLLYKRQNDGQLCSHAILNITPISLKIVSMGEPSVSAVREKTSTFPSKHLFKQV